LNKFVTRNRQPATKSKEQRAKSKRQRVRPHFAFGWSAVLGAVSLLLLVVSVPRAEAIGSVRSNVSGLLQNQDLPETDSPCQSAVSSAAALETASAPVQYPGKYIIASLALPGAGEMWRQDRTKGEIFLWADAAIWVTYGGLTIVGNARNQSAKLFARNYSGAASSYGNDDYYVNLERYANSDAYNEDVRRDARELYPTDPAKQKEYADAHYYTGSMAWSWGSDSLRYTYWNERRSARSVLHTAAFFLGAAVLNRVVSAVDVAFFSETPAARPHSAPGTSAVPSTFSRLGVAVIDDKPGLGLLFRF
jgi:hypothetical protein